ncbi:unnamed protein product [Tenebrio molitor]|nr:unnamed protein product [Tenebrio molitor]
MEWCAIMDVTRLKYRRYTSEEEVVHRRVVQGALPSQISHISNRKCISAARLDEQKC